MLGINRQVLLFLTYSLLFHIGLFGITDILLNFYLVSIGYDAETIGLLQALPRLSGFLTGLPIGIIANRLGNRRIIIVSTWGIGLCVALSVMVEGLLLLAISRFFWGVFFGAGQIVKSPFMVTLTTKEEYTSQFSYHNLVSMIAVAVGSIIGGFIPFIMSHFLAIEGVGTLLPEQMPLSYQASILLASFIIILSTLPLFCLSDKIADIDTSLTKLKQSPPWRLLIKLSFPLLIFGISGGLTFPFLNLFFREQFGITDGLIGGILGLGWLFMGIVPLINPIWELKIGRVNALTTLMLISAFAFVGLGIVETLIMAIIFYVIAISVRNTMQPLFQPLFMDSISPEFHNIASSIGLILWNIGWFSSTMSFGYLQKTIGYDNIMILVAFFVLLNGVTIHLVYRD